MLLSRLWMRDWNASLRVAEEVRDPKSKQEQDKRRQPQSPRAAGHGEGERDRGHNRGNRDEKQSFTREVQCDTSVLSERPVRRR